MKGQAKVLGALVALCSVGVLSGGGAAQAASCPNEAVRMQQKATHLPDCRAYEQVTPVDKGGQDVGFPSNEFSNTAPAAVSPDGQRLTYRSANAFPGAPDHGRILWFAVRGPGGWTSLAGNNVPGQTGDAGWITSQQALGSSLDQRAAGLFDLTTANSSLSFEGASLWVVRADGSRDKVAEASATGEPAFRAISADGGHLVFTSTDRLVPIPGEPDTEGRQLLYEWTDEGGAPQLRLVNVDSGGNLIPFSVNLGGGEVGANDPAFYRNALSADGSRIFFQSPAPEPFSGLGGGPLYLRENATTTVEVSAPDAGHSAAEQVRYLDATPDGAHVFFWANGQLTDDAPAGGGVYRFDVEAEELAWLSPGGSAQSSAFASVDGKRLYYGTLEATNFPTEVRVIEGGEDRLVTDSYLFSNPGEARFTDSAATGPGATITPDGRYLAYLSCRDPGCLELAIYRYDAVADQLAEVTALPNTNSGYLLLAELGRPGDRFRAMTDDGTVYFSSRGGLVPQDRNSRRDVYQWTPSGVSLISAGTGPFDSSISGVSSSGNDVFFSTADRLVGSDLDTNYDIYDARVGGGFLEASPFTPCQGEGCQAGSLSPPPFTAPSVVSGPGDRRARGKKPKCRGKRRGHARSTGKTKGERRQAVPRRCAKPGKKKKGGSK